MATLILLLTRTGLRIEEALALSVDDIEWRQRVVIVRRTWRT
ncbi:MAG: tyrosine-type recombinase/integrase [Candidatus Entotheonellia bacterium]